MKASKRKPTVIEKPRRKSQNILVGKGHGRRFWWHAGIWTPPLPRDCTALLLETYREINKDDVILNALTSRFCEHFSITSSRLACKMCVNPRADPGLFLGRGVALRNYFNLVLCLLLLYFRNPLHPSPRSALLSWNRIGISSLVI